MHSIGFGLRLQTGLCMPYGLWLRVATTIDYKKKDYEAVLLIGHSLIQQRLASWAATLA